MSAHPLPSLEETAEDFRLDPGQEDPLFRRVRKHAEQRFPQPGKGEEAERMSAMREFLRLEREMLLRYQRKGDGGRRVALGYSVMMDVLLEYLYENAMAQIPKEMAAAGIAQLPPVAIFALGGYGRKELCPYSDIDLMFLYPDRVVEKELAPFQKALADAMLYPLWDLGFKVGHASRTVTQAIEEAKAEPQSLNAMGEARHLLGEASLAERLTEAMRHIARKLATPEYIEARQADARERRQRYGGTIFMQEPEIKNGVGGLRDYQFVLWLGRQLLDIDDMGDLVRRGHLLKNEQRDFEAAYDFLLHVRHELHLESQRGSDVLTLEKQPQVAWQLGYRQEEILPRVEAMMKDYYRHAQAIHRVSRYMEEELIRKIEKPVTFAAVLRSRRSILRERVDGFWLEEGVLTAMNEQIFAHDPERLIRIFRHMQQRGARLDFTLERRIREDLPLLDRKVIGSATANKTMRSILQSVGEVFPTIWKMYELGVLQRMIPEFGGLECLVQHEFYHRYTADVHTLRTLQELDAVFNATGKGIESKYREAVRDTEPASLLYLILLLHDVGKGHGIKGHAEKGAEMADAILERMEVAMEVREKIVFVIRHHLEMARFWQHYDVDDPRTARSFAETVGDAENLRLLYVHTFCDARATAEGLWNGYKDMLHTRLFANTLAALGADAPTFAQPPKMIPRETLRSRLPNLSEEEIEAHYNLLPERYFIYNSVEEIILHLGMVHELLCRINEAESLGSLVPVVEWQDDQALGMTVVHIVTWDRAGLFYKLAGALAVAGLSIVSSKALTRADHITIDTFYVREPGGGMATDEKARARFEKALSNALMHNKNLMPDIQARERSSKKSSYLTKQTKLEAPVATSVDVYHELSLRRTIIEVQAKDRIGLLYLLGKIIYDHGFDITFARIATERGVAVDTFYIEKIDRTAEDDTRNLLDLREGLAEILNPTDGALKRASS